MASCMITRTYARSKNSSSRLAVPSRPRCSRGGRIIGSEPGSPSSCFMVGLIGAQAAYAASRSSTTASSSGQVAARRRPASRSRARSSGIIGQPAQLPGGPGRVAQVDQHRRVTHQFRDAARPGC